MSKIYKTVRGQAIDFDKLKLSNETTVTVGNMRTNARGDLLGAGKQVIAGRNQIMDQVYAVEPAPYSPNDVPQPETNMARAKDLVELTNNLVVPTTEETKQQDTTESTDVNTARGSLASSLAKTTTLVQEPLPKPTRKSNGPQRF